MRQKPIIKRPNNQEVTRKLFVRPPSKTLLQRWCKPNAICCDDRNSSSKDDSTSCNNQGFDSWSANQVCALNPQNFSPPTPHNSNTKFTKILTAQFWLLSRESQQLLHNTQLCRNQGKSLKDVRMKPAQSSASPIKFEIEFHSKMFTFRVTELVWP